MTIPKLLLEVQNRRSDIIQLTSDLIKIPTINPPGTNYREICEFLSKRLKKSGFDVDIIRAKGLWQIQINILGSTWLLVMRVLIPVRAFILIPI